MTTAKLDRVPVGPARITADRVIAKLRDVERLLIATTTIHQAKLVADVARAQQIFAQRQRLGTEVIGYAHEIKTHALARLGELLAVMPKSRPAGPGRGKLGTRGIPSFNGPATYADLGINKKTAAIAQQLAALPAETREAIAKQETTLREVRRDLKRDERVEKLATIARGNADLPSTVRYPVLYADPPCDARRDRVQPLVG